MIIEGNFKYFFNNEEKTREEIERLVDYATNITIGNGVVNYYSPKKEVKQILKSRCEPNQIELLTKLAENLKNSAQKKDKTKELLEEVNKHQEQNGGRVTNMEFPFDAVLTPTKWTKKDLEWREQKVIEDWNKKVQDSPSVGRKINFERLIDAQFQEVLKSGEQFKFNTTAENSNFGEKETDGKLNYELDWEFIQQMAERMNQNKGKYKPYNWKKIMDVEKLKQSLLRHTIEIMKGNYSDDGRAFGHLESLADNAMMINYQLKNNKK